MATCTVRKDFEGKGGLFCTVDARDVIIKYLDVKMTENVINYLEKESLAICANVINSSNIHFFLPRFVSLCSHEIMS